MPFINSGLSTAGVIAVSVAVAVAVAIYESPELQNMAADLRRRIAIALHALGDSITPQERENIFNRPEDAEGFLQSRGFGARGMPGVDADDASLRRQREELLYWNAVRENKKEKGSEDEKRQRRRASTAASSFDDFLQQDATAEKGALIFQSSHELQNREGLIRRRVENMRGLNPSTYTDPFADEHGIEDDIAFENNLMSPEQDEISDIYSATDIGTSQPPQTAAHPSLVGSVGALPSYSQPESQPQMSQPQPVPSPSERELGADEYMTASQEPLDGSDAYSSIQAWAQGTSHNSSFYSPLPVSPVSASETDFITDGELTPTDSASLVDVADRPASSWSSDVMSDDEAIATPASWTEVGSVVSMNDSEGGAVHA
ncbi:hypothetical protein F4861DRAFT_137085 [Xylaria intraflava]|nr:hypothetical protein F4861DRAFT_137085 [Xylaria intraflava]